MSAESAGVEHSSSAHDPGAEAEQGNNTADRVLLAAASMFRERGYAFTTTRELAARIGLQKATLYHYVRSKEDLLFKICVECVGSGIQALSDAIAVTPEEDRLKAMIKAHIMVSLRDRDMHATMLVELRALSPDRRATVVGLRDQYEALFRSAINDGQKCGRLRTDITAQYLTLSLLNLLRIRPTGVVS